MKGYVRLEEGSPIEFTEFPDDRPGAVDPTMGKAIQDAMKEGRINAAAKRLAAAAGHADIEMAVLVDEEGRPFKPKVVATPVGDVIVAWSYEGRRIPVWRLYLDMARQFTRAKKASS